jgi:hypothetical protein
VQNEATVHTFRPTKERVFFLIVITHTIRYRTSRFLIPAAFNAAGKIDK